MIISLTGCRALVRPALASIRFTNQANELIKDKHYQAFGSQIKQMELIIDKTPSTNPKI